MTNLTKLAVNLNTLDERIVDDEFLEIVNQDPPANIVKNHPMVAGVKYIPIDKIELMMTKIFQKWNVEVLKTEQILNSVCVTVRLHYRNPVTEEMTFQDGVGAMKVQVEKGENASNLQKIKPDAIMLALPAAKSYAIKDAAEHIGKVFGRDLNRKDVIAFNPSYATDEAKTAMDSKKEEVRKRLLNENN